MRQKHLKILFSIFSFCVSTTLEVSLLLDQDKSLPFCISNSVTFFFVLECNTRVVLPFKYGQSDPFSGNVTATNHKMSGSTMSFTMEHPFLLK